jgi:hypothetical protein
VAPIGKFYEVGSPYALLFVILKARLDIFYGGKVLYYSQESVEKASEIKSNWPSEDGLREES